MSSSSISASPRPVRASVLPRARKIGQAPRPSAATPSYAQPTIASRARCGGRSSAQSASPASPASPAALAHQLRPILRRPPTPANVPHVPHVSHGPTPRSLTRFGFLRAPVTNEPKNEEDNDIHRGNFASLLVEVLGGQRQDDRLPERLDKFRKAEEARVVASARKVHRSVEIGGDDQIPVYSAAVALVHPPRAVRWDPVLTRRRQFYTTDKVCHVGPALRFSSRA
ncbi:hypothetical protein IWX49DRAFT_620672 [Phyllosticta citricarpa]